jgi:BMFP domain-containing protein YqiC
MPGLIESGSIPIVERHSGGAPGCEGAHVTQTTNRFLDELSKLLTDAAGAAQGMRREVETLMKAQGERILRDMDVVQREEFEAVKEMAAKARDENERLSARISELERELARLRQ